MLVDRIEPPGAAGSFAGVQHDGASPLGGASRLLAELEAWVAGASADAAVDDRRRARALAEQAAEEGTLVGVLVDLGERGSPVVVTTRGGRAHRGRVALVGRDLVVVVLEPRGVALVRTGAIGSVRTAPATTAVTGARTTHLEVGWVEALGVLAAERPRVQVGLAGGATAAGELRGVGADVVTLRLDGEGGRAYLPVGATDDVVVDDVGLAEAFR
jgi:hypothetical protein